MQSKRPQHVDKIRPTAPVTGLVKLKWQKFTNLTDARSRFAKTSCVYVQTDAGGWPLRIGKASEGLEPRYRGGAGYAMDAAKHHSGNLVFVAAVEKKLCGFVENELIWQGKRCLTYNNLGKLCRQPTACFCRIPGHHRFGTTSMPLKRNRADVR